MRIVLIILVGLLSACATASEEEPAPAESVAEQPSPVAFKFEITKAGEVVSRPGIATLPGHPMTIESTTDNTRFVIELSATVVGDDVTLTGTWREETDGEIAASDSISPITFRLGSDDVQRVVSIGDMELTGVARRYEEGQPL